MDSLDRVTSTRILETVHIQTYMDPPNGLAKDRRSEMGRWPNHLILVLFERGEDWNNRYHTCASNVARTFLMVELIYG